MKKIRVECSSCEGVGSFLHDLDHTFYNVEFCPFCGEELELEEEFVNDEPFEGEEEITDY
jgi:hypothetical protein|tara:strand:- start:2924 stop:3103 length:180 start_codon:yes stop_codon:yes gene_type:complete